MANRLTLRLFSSANTYTPKYVRSPAPYNVVPAPVAWPVLGYPCQAEVAAERRAIGTTGR